MEGSQPLCLDPVLYAAAIIISREDPSRDSAIRDAPRLPRARHQAATGARPRGLYDLDDHLGDHDDLGPRLDTKATSAVPLVERSAVWPVARSDQVASDLARATAAGLTSR
jgi:hypothetical protein